MDSNLLKFIKDSPQIIDKEVFEKSAKEAGKANNCAEKTVIKRCESEKEQWILWKRIMI